MPSILRKALKECSCGSCGIRIGDGCLETEAFKVGEITICGDCYFRLKNDKRVELGEVPGNSHTKIRRGRLTTETSLFLYPDGTIKRELVTPLDKGF